MSEIEKLKKRLKNVGKNVTQYNMTVAEAWTLVNEHDALEEAFRNQLTEMENLIKEYNKPRSIPAPIIRNIDGGTF